jgi:endonuclease/exonuclease/phosphatase (EEP) superfamily protein YafD
LSGGTDGATPARRPGRVLAGVAAAALWAGCLPVTVQRLRGGTGGAYQALLAALVPWTLPVLAGATALAVAGRGRRPWSVAVVAVPVASLALHVAWVAPSLLPDRAAVSPPIAAGSATVVPQRIRVLALNLEFGQADAATVVDVVRRERVDVLLAVELTPDAVRRLRAAGLESLLPTAVLEPSGGATGSGLWTRLPATAVPSLAGTTFRTPRARLTLPSGRTVLVTAAHPHPPLRAQWWARDLGLITGAVRAAGDEPQILGGDYNATLDHVPFRELLDTGLTDAADAVGVTGGAWPGMTWPADRSFPPMMRLDHVLFSSGALAAADVSTVTVPGTDHRGVITTVQLR